MNVPIEAHDEDKDKDNGIPAGPYHIGEICYFCEHPIAPNEKVRFYGGPFLIHQACLEKVLDC